MNPVIKFTTLFGLLAVSLAVSLKDADKLTGEKTVHTPLTTILTIGFFAVSMFFVWRSFYGMRIGGQKAV